jgi:subtilase family serine protease
MFRRSLFRQLWRHASRRAQAFRVHLHCEQLEQRAVPAVYPLTPAAVRHAYGFDQIVGDGAGQTIAIIDAYDAPNIFKDADNFDKTFAWSSTGLSLYSQFGASSSWLTKVSPSGRLPRANVGWAEEISLDVEWAHAIAPAAKIMLVEASSNSLSALLGAVDYATNHGAQVVSMSWGSNEFSGETAYDFHFNHPGVTYVASAGDVGGVTEWPAVSPNVVSVGGTSLKVDTSGN